MLSRNGPPRTALKAPVLIAFLVGSLLIGSMAYIVSQAAASGSSAFNITPNPVTVGTVANYNFTVRNVSDAPQDTETVQLTLIQGYPACFATDPGAPGIAPCDQPGDQNPGVFTPAATGTGRVGTACAGTTFNVTEAASGLWTFVPTGAGDPVLLQPANLGAANLLTTCIIDGTATVDALPGNDSNGGLAGFQTRQLSYAEGFTSVTLDEFTGSGTASITVVKLPSTTTTTSNPTGPNVLPGTSVVDNATVSGTGPVPTGNVTFFLCQPAEVTAAGCPSPAGTQIGAAKALAAGAATSDATTNTNALGKYCWRAAYAGNAVYDPSTHTNATTECFTVEKLPSTTTTTSNPTGPNVLPGTSVVDNATVSGTGPVPTGNVTFFLCQPAEVTAAGCPAGGTQIGAVKALAAGAATSDATTNTNTVGTYCWRAEYAGDTNYLASSHTNATTECFTVAKLPSSTTTTANPTGTGVLPGTSVVDNATVTGTGPVPTGDVTFFLCQPAEVTAAGCPAGGTQIGAVKALAAGAATSDATSNTNTPGKYCWRAEYAGNTVYDPSSHTNATTECFTVEKLVPTVATTANPTGAGVIPGTSVVDNVTVSGTGPVPTGNVTFFLCQPAAVTAAGCPSPAGTQVGAAKALAAGAATSDATTNTTTLGKYCWRAEYAGDTSYEPGTHTNATTECFTVDQLTPTIATTANPTGPGVIPGASVADNATVSGTGPVPTGNVAFFLCQPADVTAAGCPSGGTQVGAAKALVAGAATSDSTNNTTTTGKYCWRAEYAGDAVYEPDTHTNATTECFTVSKLEPVLATGANPSGTGVAPGTSVVDNGSVSGSGPVPTGNVTFHLCQPAEVTAAGCPSGGTQIGAVKVLAAGLATSDATTNTTTLGKYCWRLEYAGDSVYEAGTHTNATTECFTVEKRTPQIVTASNPTGTGVAPGTSVTDKATVSGSGPIPTGNVTFFLCQPATVTANGGTCVAGGTQVGAAKALVAGVATSDSTANTVTNGKYCWRVEYAGDAAYLAGSHTNSSTECFTVKTDPDLTVDKELKPGQPKFAAGGRVYYLISVKNIGGAATPPPPNNVTVIDTPPAGTSIVAWSMIKGAGICSVDGAGRLVCDLGASMAAGAEAIIEVVIRTPKAGEITNTVEVDPFKRIQESDEGNNKDTLVVVVP